jgi:ABC-2 type transport system permease protein
MMRGLWALVWLEIKIFLREPLGVIGSVVMPVLVFLLLGRLFQDVASTTTGTGGFRQGVPVLVAMLISVNAVLSLVTIIAIYREGGILKRLRATPLRPQTILTAHVVVKLLLTALTLVAMLAAGRRYFPIAPLGRAASFGVAILFTTFSITSIGFLVASLVPTARFAQPIGALVLYPMLAISGLFAPIEVLPPAARLAARVFPFTYAVSLLRGIWNGEGWLSHLGDVAVLAVVFVACTALSAKVFRWE